MVLSDGSTEHGGYHEALIGLGWVLGPAAGTAAAWLKPHDPRAGVAAVGTLIARWCSPRPGLPRSPGELIASTMLS